MKRLLLFLLLFNSATTLSAQTAPLLAPKQMVQAAGDVGVVVPDRVQEHHLVKIKLGDGEKCQIFASNLQPVDAVRSYGGVVFTGPPGRYAVIVSNPSDADEVLPPVYYVEIYRDGPAPPPIPPTPIPPNPDVIPPGFAGDVCKAALQINDKAGTVKLKDNYQKVLSIIAAGGIKTPAEAKAQISELNKALKLPQTWLPFGQWLGAQANAKAQTITATRTFFQDVVTGLEAAAR